jgi:hypothetical protein
MPIPHSPDEQAAESKEGTATQPSGVRETSTDKNRVFFRRLDRAAQLEAFLIWLPPELHQAPQIDWAALPAETMGYLIQTVGKSPNAPSLALAAALACSGMGAVALTKAIGNLYRLLGTLRKVCRVEVLSDLQQEQVWREYAQKTPRTASRLRQLASYSSLSGSYLPDYLQRLDVADRLRMQCYTLPPLPQGFLKKYSGQKALTAAGKAARKAQSDVLVPLYPVLRQLIRFRKQVAERTFKAIREVSRQAEEGNIVPPFSFTHTDVFPYVNRDARTISDVQISGREVTMHFVLWNKRTWALEHEEHYSSRTVESVKAGSRGYAADEDRFFVQYVGPPGDLLWFGDLLEHGLLRHIRPSNSTTDEQKKRAKVAAALGFTSGCVCSRPGVLHAADYWLAREIRADDLLFAPEALYRGVLYAATLATIALSNGSRVSELLQVSLDRRMTHTETVTVLGKDGLPVPGSNGRSLTKQVKLHFQYLLPKGAKTEEERQLFPLSKEAVRLLGEIKQGLEAVHGEIPIVHPSLSHTKYEHLRPERYFLQWAASSDGQQGLLTTADVEVLLRFMFHGLELYTTGGKPIRVTAHILRHVMATDARQYRQVPPEAIAYFFLHHRLQRVNNPPLSFVSEYYWQMTQEQQLALLREYLDAHEEQDRALALITPTPHDLERMNEDVRAVYEQWHTLHPTAFGNCGCPGLCPRGNDRALCLGCSYLVTDPEKLGAVLAWRASYAEQAEQLEIQGNTIDARQARIKVQQLDDVVNVMRLQLQAELDGGYIPAFKLLPKPGVERKESDEEDL